MITKNDKILHNNNDDDKTLYLVLSMWAVVELCLVLVDYMLRSCVLLVNGVPYAATVR